MEKLDKVRNELISKILSIKNEDFLLALDKLVTTSNYDDKVIELTDAQKKMLEMSEYDIKNGRLISQEAMNKRNLEWLNAKQFGQKQPTFNYLEYLNIGYEEINQIPILRN